MPNLNALQCVTLEGNLECCGVMVSAASTVVFVTCERFFVVHQSNSYSECKCESHACTWILELTTLLFGVDCVPASIVGTHVDTSPRTAT
jgi:hypothetical protein